MSETEPKVVRPIGVRTEGFDELLSEGLFHARKYEQSGPLHEQKRDALVGVHDKEGRAVQFIVTLTRSAEGGLITRIEPTFGAITSFIKKVGIDISAIRFMSNDLDITTGLRDVMTQMQAAGYSIDPKVKNTLGKS